MTLEMERSPLAPRPVVHRTPADVRADRLAAAKRTDAALHVLLVTLIWLVVVPFLLGWGLLGQERQPGTMALSAVLAVVLPFLAAVIATRNRLYFTAGVYMVLTLVMMLPAAGILRAG